jgi:small subunit ribosomal protein S5
MAKRNRRRQNKKYDTKVVSIRRVAKVTSGGRRLRFSAMVVAGDRKGSVGVSLGRGVDTRSAIEKAERKAAKNMTKIELVGDTIPHEIVHKSGACRVMLRPAKPGTGVVAGSSVRTVLELCGIENVYGKILGSNDLVGNTYCAFEALKEMRNERVLKKMKKMQARIGLKEELEKERERRRRAMGKKKKRDGKKGRRSKRGRKQNSKGKKSKSKRSDKKQIKKKSTKKEK